MSEKGKLFVFDRLEVFFILLLMVLVAITSFTIGVKIGKGFAYEDQGFSEVERRIIDLKSEEEEEVSAISDDELSIDKGELQDNSNQILKERFQQTENKELRPGIDKPAPMPAESEVTPMEAQSKELVKDLNDNAYKGKWTVQLGSYADKSDAEKFADGIKVLGYNPLINEVNIEGRGVWFRVGLGVFDTVSEAKAYIDQEESLFQGKDYTIVKLQ